MPMITEPLPVTSTVAAVKTLSTDSVPPEISTAATVSAAFTFTAPPVMVSAAVLSRLLPALRLTVPPETLVTPVTLPALLKMPLDTETPPFSAPPLLVSVPPETVARPDSEKRPAFAIKAPP